MRPRGEIRQALSASAWELSLCRPSVTYREIAAHANVGWDAARQGVRDMARAGELVVVGQARMEGVCRPLNAYRAASVADPAQRELIDRTVELTNAVNSWASFV